MEGKEMQHQGRSRSRRTEDDDDRSFQEVKRNERKKKRQRSSGNSISGTTSATALSHQQQSPSNVGSGNASNGGSSATTGGNRYHHREVPPRFQHTKLSSGPKHSSKTNQALSKKTVKESNRWSHPQQSVPSTSTYSSGNRKTDDGGWSMGTPERGSGWGATTRTYSTNSDSWGNLDTNESNGAAPSTESDKSTSSEQEVLNSLWHSSKTSGSDGQSYQELAWTKDNEEEQNGSHTPGGLMMIASSREDNDTSSLPQDDFMGINNWGDPKAKPMMGNNWKISPRVHEKDNFVASDWDDADLSFGENSQCPTLSNGNPALSKEHSLSHLEFESSSLDRYDPAFVGESSHSGAGTPNSRSSGGATPTQETGGRTSAGSTSSVNSIGSGSSWKSDGKGGKTYTNRLGSPRKPNRYDRSNSQSGTSGIGSDKESNGLYKTRKPKKSLAELEGGLGSLHCEPSGWGELPSPKPCDVDNGTELWGVPPVDRNRLVNKAAEPKKGSLNGSGLADTITQVVSTPSIEWRDEDSSGAMAAGWNKDDGSKILTSRTPTTSMSQWGPINESGWGNKLQNDVSSYSDSQRTIDAKSPQDDYHKASIDHDGLESLDEASSDMALLNKRFGKGSSADSVHGGSKDSQQLSSMKQTPHSSASSPSIQNQLLFLKLLQGNGGQQVLTQRLGQLQMHKQQLIQQLNQLSRSTGSGMNTVLQQNQAKLASINQMITQANQQLMILSQLSSQKDVGRNVETCSTSVSSPKMVHNPPLPMRLKNDPKANGSFTRSQSANAMVGLGIGSVEPSKNLAYGLQNLSLNSPVQSNVSQSSARSMSRLQQIISGSSSDNLASLSGRDDGAFQSSLPMTPGSQNSSFPAPVSYQHTSPFSPPQSGSLSLGSDNHSFPSGGTSASFTSKKSVSDIQEFRPGVPWQPKSQATEPAQVYCKQSSVPSGNSYHDGNVFNQQPGPQQVPFGSNIQLMRSQSTSGSYYNSAQTKYGQGIGYEKQLNLRMGRKTPGHGHYQPKPPTPSPEVINVGLGWKPKGRTVIPPSSLYPSQDFHYKPGYGTRKHNRMTGTPQSHYNTPATDQKSWDSSFSADTPSSSSSMISNTVWGSDSDSVTTSEESRQQGWSQGYTRGSHTWMDNRMNHLQHHPPPSFTSPPSQSNTSPAECYTPTSVGSLTSGRGAWGQDELNSLNMKHGINSPEPTFAEWQAGKRARLSVGTFRTNPPSPWLVLRSLNSQFNEDSLRELFSKYGAVREWIVCPALECSLLHCQSIEDSFRIKECVDSNMVENGAVVQFASKADVDMITKQNHEVSPVSWLSESTNSSADLPPPPEDCNLSSSASPATPFSRVLPTSGWDSSSSSSNAPSLGRQSSEATTPGSSLWSDSGFLSGLSSPWHGSLPVPGATVPSSTTSPQGNAGPNGGEAAPTSSNPSMSPFLPNGLL